MHRQGNQTFGNFPPHANEISFEGQPRLGDNIPRSNNPNQHHYPERPPFPGFTNRLNLSQNNSLQEHPGQFHRPDKNPFDTTRPHENPQPVGPNRMFEPRLARNNNHAIQCRPRFTTNPNERFPYQEGHNLPNAATERLSSRNMNIPSPSPSSESVMPVCNTQFFLPNQVPAPVNVLPSERMGPNHPQNISPFHINQSTQPAHSAASYTTDSGIQSVPSCISNAIKNQFQQSFPPPPHTAIANECNPPHAVHFTATQQTSLNLAENEKNISFSNFPDGRPFFDNQDLTMAHIPFSSASMIMPANEAHSFNSGPIHSVERQIKDENIHFQEHDKLWIAKWLLKRGTAQKIKTSSEEVKIHSAQTNIEDVMTCLAKLNNQRDVMANILSDCMEERWSIERKKLLRLEEELERKMKFLEDNDVMEELQKKIKRRKKKRERVKRKRLEKSEQQKAALEKREELHRKIDSWQNQLIQENLDKIQEKELKKQADNILGEVRKKLIETEKKLEMIRSLEKLRKIRKEAAQKRGLYATLESDNIFDEKMKETEEILLKQKKIYDDEEMTLKVMLETEQEENREKEKEKERQRLEEIEERHQKKLKKILFGKEEVIYPDNPMYTFVKFYEQANESFESFLKIRQDWDAFIVPENTPGASKIPLGFVVPVKPSNKIWKTALKNH